MISKRRCVILGHTLVEGIDSAMWAIQRFIVCFRRCRSRPLLAATSHSVRPEIKMAIYSTYIWDCWPNTKHYRHFNGKSYTPIISESSNSVRLDWILSYYLEVCDFSLSCVCWCISFTGRCPPYISDTVLLVPDHASRSGLRSASTSRYS